MSKTSLEPWYEREVKKLFIECDEGRDHRIKFGRVKLASGKRTMGPWSDFVPVQVQVTKIGSTAGNTYTVDISRPGQFTIISSDTSGTEEMFWLAIGK